MYYVNYRAEQQVLDSSLVVGNLAMTESDHDLLKIGAIDDLVSGVEETIGESELAWSSDQRVLFREMLCLALLLMTLETVWLTSKHSGHSGGGRRR